jgi:DNA-binding NarL/FixJ family response regulator
MSSNKIFTYVSPKTGQQVAASLCGQMPIILQPVNTVEELFPLLSDPAYYTDFVCIDIGVFSNRSDNLDMFDIIHTLSTLIKSTVYRSVGGIKPKKRDTKIFVIVDHNTDPRLVRQVMNFPDIVSVGWIPSKQEHIPGIQNHIDRMVAGDFSHHEKVLELVKNKKKETESTGAILLTARQSQVLQLVQDRGASNKTIAKMLNLSESTVKLHMGAIFKKYGVKSRTQLAVFARGQLTPTVH